MKNENEFTSAEGIRYEAVVPSAVIPSDVILCCRICALRWRKRCDVPRLDPNEPDCRPYRRADNRQIVWQLPQPKDPNPL